MSEPVRLRILRGEAEGGQRLVDYEVPAVEGMVVLDAVHHVQRHLATDLACRWNCKAGRCGSCSAEVNGRPALLCTTRVDSLPPGPITVAPMRAFPLVKDLVTDVSVNYGIGRRIPGFTAEARGDGPEACGDGPSASGGAPEAGGDGPAAPGGAPWRMAPGDIERLHELRRCIECFLCQDVCHVLRDHRLADRFHGPRHLVRLAALEMHPRDTVDRTDYIATAAGIDCCNVTRCCTEVCPEHIRITDNAIIPLKERGIDARRDPFRRLAQRLRRRSRG